MTTGAMPIHIEATGIGFVEGPLVLGDALLFCDLHQGVVKRLRSGETTIVYDAGGVPNGIAIGPDGMLYVANNGGAMRWGQEGDQLVSRGFEETGFDARIDRVDLADGSIARVLDKVDGRRFQAIDDLVFHPTAGFWFTDLGRDGERSRTYGGIYWSSLDGSDVREVAYPLVNGANGLGVSYDGRTLYATEYGAGRLWSWSIEAPGRLRLEDGQPHGGRLLWQAPDALLLDSLKVAPSGNIVIATQPVGVFSVISPEGRYLGAVDVPDSFPTNICFDPGDDTVAYATLARTSRLARIEWDETHLGGANQSATQTGGSE
ncbi:SMP-30/gluconolactonase/LRE family protein [Sphingomonas faeni]|uniref:SMP-30/gluconolactonase/LRE family protein n=1 Tax=Sphingomonas faeni TaxID=185950 RepID=UPI0024130C94|nr:SMP-30/gluconolactonase/LRE family protein [Sphingomonas faeni]